MNSYSTPHHHTLIFVYLVVYVMPMTIPNIEINLAHVLSVVCLLVILLVKKGTVCLTLLHSAFSLLKMFTFMKLNFHFK